MKTHKPYPIHVQLDGKLYTVIDMQYPKGRAPLALAYTRTMLGKRIVDNISIRKRLAQQVLEAKMERQPTRSCISSLYQMGGLIMFIQAKYVSKCPYCNGVIHVGQNVYWVPGSKPVHEVCWEKRKRQTGRGAHVKHVHARS